MVDRSMQFVCAVAGFLSSDKMGHGLRIDPAIGRAWRRIRIVRWLFRAGLAGVALTAFWPVGPDWSEVPTIVMVALILGVLVLWAKIDLTENQLAAMARQGARTSGHPPVMGRGC